MVSSQSLWDAEPGRWVRVTKHLHARSPALIPYSTESLEDFLEQPLNIMKKVVVTPQLHPALLDIVMFKKIN